MKIGSLDIIKAYLGALELLNSNAFLGDIPLVEGGPTPVGYAGLKFTSTGNSTVELTQQGSAPIVALDYSLDDGDTWIAWDYSTISLTDGQTVCFKGQNTAFATSTTDYNKFVMTGSIAASGNIMSIIDNGACTTTTIPADYCFVGLFYGCTSLTTAPELPATTLTASCYRIMFQGCTSLTNAPSLTATTLAQDCYRGMFQECSSLVTTPTLSATTLQPYCYRSMFFGCTSLTTAPVLPATTLTEGCYQYMFNGCTNLNYIKCLATNISASNCTSGWVYSVAEMGLFVKNPDMDELDWGIPGVDGIPDFWTVEDAA